MKTLGMFKKNLFIAYYKKNNLVFAKHVKDLTSQPKSLRKWIGKKNLTELMHLRGFSNYIKECHPIRKCFYLIGLQIPVTRTLNHSLIQNTDL